MTIFVAIRQIVKSTNMLAYILGEQILFNDTYNLSRNEYQEYEKFISSLEKLQQI